MHGAWQLILFASPAPRQGCDHFIHEPAEVVDGASADHVLAHHQTCAEGVQHTIQVAAHQPTWRVERPCAHICNAMSVSTAVHRTCQHCMKAGPAASMTQDSVFQARHLQSPSFIHTHDASHNVAHNALHIAVRDYLHNPVLNPPDDNLHNPQWHDCPAPAFQLRCELHQDLRTHLGICPSV